MALKVRYGLELFDSFLFHEGNERPNGEWKDKDEKIEHRIRGKISQNEVII